MKIGVIGLGRMGMAVCKRLVEQGHVVVGWDIDQSLASVIEEAGGRFCADPAEVVRRSDSILTLVTDDAAAIWLFSDEGGLLQGNAEGKLFIELSTLQPSTVVQIGECVLAVGGAFVGAPVLGSIPTVSSGKLLVLAGGAVEHVERARMVLQPLAHSVVHLGSLGAGNVMKLIVNLTMASYLEALSEGLALGLEHGLSLEQMLQILAGAVTANPWLSSKLKILAGEPGEVSLDIALMQKDVLSAVTVGSAAGVAMPMASGILASLSTAVATGHGREDMALLPKVFRENMVRRRPETSR